MLAPAVWRDDAFVGAAAHTVGDPLREVVVVGLRPAAVDLEPRERVAQRFLGGPRGYRPGRFSSFFACLSARFSFRDLPGFLALDFFGDLSAMGAPRFGQDSSGEGTTTTGRVARCTT